MLKAIKNWLNDERINAMRESEKEKNALITQLQKDKRELQSKERKLKRDLAETGGALSSAAQKIGELPWVFMDDQEPYTHKDGREDILLLMPSGKMLRARVASKYRATGGDMFSGTTYWLETTYGEKVGGNPVAWLQLKMPKGFIAKESR